MGLPYLFPFGLEVRHFVPTEETVLSDVGEKTLREQLEPQRVGTEDRGAGRGIR